MTCYYCDMNKAGQSMDFDTWDTEVETSVMFEDMRVRVNMDVWNIIKIQTRRISV